MITRSVVYNTAWFTQNSSIVADIDIEYTLSSMRQYLINDFKDTLKFIRYY